MFTFVLLQHFAICISAEFKTSLYHDSVALRKQPPLCHMSPCNSTSVLQPTTEECLKVTYRLLIQKKSTVDIKTLFLEHILSQGTMSTLKQHHKNHCLLSVCKLFIP